MDKLNPIIFSGAVIPEDLQELRSVQKPSSLSRMDRFLERLTYLLFDTKFSTYFSLAVIAFVAVFWLFQFVRLIIRVVL